MLKSADFHNLLITMNPCCSREAWRAALGFKPFFTVMEKNIRKNEREKREKKEEERSPLALCNPTCPGWYKDTVLSWSSCDQLLMFLLSENVLFAVSVNVVKRIEEVDY